MYSRVRGLCDRKKEEREKKIGISGRFFFNCNLFEKVKKKNVVLRKIVVVCLFFFKNIFYRVLYVQRSAKGLIYGVGINSRDTEPGVLISWIMYCLILFGKTAFRWNIYEETCRDIFDFRWLISEQRSFGIRTERFAFRGRNRRQTWYEN